LNKNEVVNILNHFNSAPENKFNKERNELIFHIFIHCGLRVSELINLKLSDVDFINNFMVIHGKGNKERIIRLDSNTSLIIKDYVENIRGKSIHSGNSEYLFVSQKSGRFTVKGINMIFENIYKDVGLSGKDYCVHTLRKTCASLMSKAGVDVVTIRDILGHANIATTNIYLASFDEDKVKAAETLNEFINL